MNALLADERVGVVIGRGHLGLDLLVFDQEILGFLDIRRRDPAEWFPFARRAAEGQNDP